MRRSVARGAPDHYLQAAPEPPVSESAGDGF
jgi:hypothetical protein